MAKRHKTPAEKYIHDVARGRIPAGKWVQLAVRRHMQDLKDGHKRGLYFDSEAAQHKIDFFKFLRHSKGEWAGKVFELSGWEHFILWCVFGWKKKDGTRRFRVAYVEVPKKNGKTTLAAGIGLGMLVADDEPGAEVYVAATKRDQAKLTHVEAERMVKRSRELSGHVNVYRNNLSVPATMSKFEPLGRDSASTEGINTSAGILDELHAHKTRDMWDVIDTSTAARRQPLILAITTAGWDRHSVCYEQHDYVCKILEQVINDDSYFGYIACADEGDDWRLVSTWRKANPNLGVTVKLEDLKRKAKKARRMPSAQNAFRRLHLDEWTEQAERWLDMPVWDACNGRAPANRLLGLECFGGLDLATTTDLAAFAMFFPPQIDDLWHLLVHFFVPRETLRKRSKDDRVPYDVWAREGFITATEGNVIDYAAIRQHVNNQREKYRITEIAYDRWNATQIVTELVNDNANMIPFGQGFASLSAPTKEFEKLMLARQIAHGGNPVMRWMASSVAVTRDAADNMKPNKEKSKDRIDGIIASVMALGRAIVNGSSKKEWGFEQHGIRTL